MKKQTTLFLVFLFALGFKFSHAQEIKNPWLKKPMPGLKMTAAYMTIANNTKKELVLEKVSGPDAKFYEIHTHSKVNGVMKMRKLESLSIPIGKEVVLKPMSYHIMLLQMPKTPFEKKSTQLTLHFSNGPQKTVELPVKKN